MILVMPLVTAGQTYVYTTSEGDVWFDCENSWANVTNEDGSLIGNGSDFTVAIQEGNHTFSFEQETKCQFVIPVNGDLPDNRPSPTESFETLDANICSQVDYIDDSCNSHLVSGNVSDGDNDIFAVNVSDRQLVSLELERSVFCIRHSRPLPRRGK